MPLQAPPRPPTYEAPWAPSITLENIKRVADFWCCGDCDRARKLEDGLFMGVLAHVLTKEEGRAIEAEESARADRRADKFSNLGK